MMENLWKLDEVITIDTLPEEIIKQQCQYLKQLTEGRVIGNVKRYSGPLSSYSYKQLGVADAIAEATGGSYTVNVDIQEKLGDVGSVPEIYFSYEFYLTSPNTPKYKFRVMFFSYVKGQYPIDLVLDSDIAADIRTSTSIDCVSEGDFMDTLARILNSEKVRSVVNALHALSTESSA